MNIKIFLSMSLLLFSSLTATTVIEDKATLPLKAPSFLERKTLKIRLDNGLEAYLISDPKTDQSGALLAVQVGSWEDPDEHPGMAHFLEHLLFLGTEKYPDENEYQRYIKDHGGRTNAFTANQMTSYMFSVDNDAFEGALDRFSGFFSEPLFNPSGVARELQAIDQEYAKNIENDDFRELFVRKHLSRKNHPQYRFNIGSSETLKNVSREELKEWYKDHYSANLMRLMVVSPLPLETLKDDVVKMFSTVPTSTRTRYINKEQYSDESTLGKMVIIRPVKDTRSVTLVWELPEEFSDMEESKPDTLACFILGHEGQESLLAQLKREDLADSLSCGSYDSGAKKNELSIQIGLTSKGIHELNTVIKRTFQAINTFRNKGIPDHLFDEIKQIKTLQYQYQEREDVFMTLMLNGMTITEEPMETYPEQTKIIQKNDPVAINSLFSYMTPKNAIIVVRAPLGTTNSTLDKEEPWLKANYTVKSIGPELLKEWTLAKEHPNIDLPGPNPFIPTNFDLVAPSCRNKASVDQVIPTPEVLSKDDSGLFYWACDTDYLIPKVSLHFTIKTPKIIVSDPESIVMGDLYVKALNDALIKYSYPADMAGLKYEVSRDDNGLGLRIYGFSDKAERMLDTILDTLHNTKLDVSSFNTYKESLIRDYQNFSKESPLAQNFETLKKVLYLNYTTARDKTVAIRKISQTKFKEFVEQLFNETYIESVLFGNLDKTKASEIVSKVKKTFTGKNYSSTERYKPEIIDIPDDRGPLYIENQTKTQGNAAILAIEYLPFSFKSNAVHDILSQGMSEPFFSDLRTKQQTGYIVFNTSKDIERHLFNFFAVQSNTHNPRDLLARFELFIEGFLQEMTSDQLPEVRFEKIRNATIKTLKTPAKNLFEMGTLLDTLAFDYQGDFEWLQKRINALESLMYPEFVSLSRDMLGRQNPKRLAALLKGATPEGKILDYTKMRSANEVKKLSTYQPG